MLGKHWNRLEVKIQFMALSFTSIYILLREGESPSGSAFRESPPSHSFDFCPKFQRLRWVPLCKPARADCDISLHLFPPLNRKIRLPPHFHSLNSKLIPNIPPGERQV